MPQLRDFQREDVNYIKDHGFRTLLANAPGTGKTVTALVALSEGGEPVLPAVVIAPASVLAHWHREARKWAPWMKVQAITDGTTPLPPYRFHLYIISWALLDARHRELERRGVRTIVADEAHFAKNPEAYRSMALFHMARRTKHMLLLTGTPLINSMEELRTLKSLFGTSEPPMIRRLIEDVAPDIPPKVRSLIRVELSVRDRASYTKANDDFEHWLETELAKRMGDGEARDTAERALTAEALVKVGYLRRLVGEAKVNAASDWIARAVRIGEQVVVFAEHQAVIRKLTKRLRKQRIRHVLLDGGTPRKRRQQAIDLFQSRKVPVFIGSKAAKEGITLTAAKHLLFIERFWTSAEEEQAEDRIRRITQRHPTKIWFLEAEDTIDERIAGIIDGKRTLIFNAIGNAETAETPEKNVLSLLQGWTDHSESPKRKTVALGLGDPLPPLPSPKRTHAIIFTGKRWNRKSALAWSTMNGYHPVKVTQTLKGLKVVNHPPNIFKRGTFSTVSLAKDIKVLIASRLPHKQVKQVGRYS